MGRVMHLGVDKSDVELVVGEHALSEVRLHVNIPDIGTVKGSPDEVLAWLDALTASAHDRVDRWRAGIDQPKKHVQ